MCMCISGSSPKALLIKCSAKCCCGHFTDKGIRNSKKSSSVQSQLVGVGMSSSLGQGKRQEKSLQFFCFLLTNGQYLDIFPTSTQMSSSIPCTAPTRLCLSYCQNLWVNKEHRNTHTKKYNIYMFFPPPKWPQDFWRSATLCSFANNIKTPRVLK